jgi:hypothetical protein
MDASKLEDVETFVKTSIQELGLGIVLGEDVH